MPAPLATKLRTAKARVLGRSPDQSAIGAICARARGFVRVVISFEAWTWRRYPESEQGRDPKTGKPIYRRVWISPDHWDQPGYVAVEGLTYDGSMPPRPLLLPWNNSWTTGSAPKGMDADLGVLIDSDPEGRRGYAVLGMRRPSPLEAFVLTWRSKPWIFGTPTFYPTDWCADGFSVETETNYGKVFGRGGVRKPKRKYIVTNDEIRAGVIEHAIAIVDSRIQHGPTPPRSSGIGPPRCAGADARVEHPDRDPNPKNPSPAGDVPSRYPHGTTFAHTWTRAELLAMAVDAGLIGQTRATFLTITIAMGEDEGYGCRVVETGTGPDMMIETDGPLDGLDAVTTATILDRVLVPSRMVVLNPAA